MARSTGANRVPFSDLIAQHASIGSELDVAIRDTLADARFVGGPSVSSFEDEFAHYVGTTNCVGVGNGTDALEIALQVLNLPENSEVLVPANSFVATAEAVSRSGLRPVFVDVDQTYTIDLKSAERALSSNTSAVIAVHLYGHPCDMDGVNALAAEHRLRVVEDCAQAHGATLAGRPVGSFGDAAAFSFYPGKNLGAFGDGGAVTFRNDDLATQARMLANHGRLAKFDHQFVGRNSRLDSIQASVLSVKLRHLDSWVCRRRVIAERYRQNLAELETIAMAEEERDAEHAFHLFVIRSSRRDELASFLAMAGVSTGIHYPVAIPAVPAYRSDHLGYCWSMRAVGWADEVLSLPCHEMMTDNDVDYVSELVCDFDRVRR